MTDADAGEGADSDWELLRQLLEEAQGGLTLPERNCGRAGRMLALVSGARGSLDRLEHSLQAAHLTCCLLPGVQIPDDLVLALARLSWQGVGALVAVEQQESLDEYIARGTRLDAQLSASLLESLFHPGSALHDGATIVRASRIMAAGVFLPVTTERRDPEHGRLLGARHRAALGLSRVTDAVVFVVSEETGEISVAIRGLLHHAVHIESTLGAGASSSESRRIAFPRDRSWLGRLRGWWHAPDRQDRAVRPVGSHRR